MDVREMAENFVTKHGTLDDEDVAEVYAQFSDEDLADQMVEAWDLHDKVGLDEAVEGFARLRPSYLGALTA